MFKKIVLAVAGFAVIAMSTADAALVQKRIRNMALSTAQTKPTGFFTKTLAQLSLAKHHKRDHHDQAEEKPEEHVEEHPEETHE